MRVLVCGGREFANFPLLERAMREHVGVFRGPNPAITVIQGGAPGADSLAQMFAMKVGWSIATYLADWKAHGKAAGPIRNQQMLDEGKPDLVIALPGGRGTADMVRRARKAGVEVREILP